MITTFQQFLNENKNIENIKLNNNFWKWFDGSKVVDDEGKPLVVYHATNTDFKTFDFKNSLQKIIWFTNDINAIKNKEIGAAGDTYVIELYV